MSSALQYSFWNSLSRKEKLEMMFNMGQLLLSWLFVLLFVGAALFTEIPHDPLHPRITRGPHNELLVDGYIIPPTTLSDFGSYPNPLKISERERRLFRPVVVFPKVWMELNETGEAISFGFDGIQPRIKRTRVPNYSVLDLQNTSATSGLASEEERQERRNHPSLAPSRKHNNKTAEDDDDSHLYMVGRYDENRVNLYASDLFDDTSNSIDSYEGQRTLHIGIDLDGPVGTKVFAFTDGVVYQSGYNAALGDYGNVVIVEHQLENGMVYALYGHLDDKSVQNKPKGTRVKRGRLIGRMGDIHENGGWRTPHVHFQLSIHPPETHDMPGVVAMEDRPRALVHYPDPRYVLGPLY